MGDGMNKYTPRVKKVREATRDFEQACADFGLFPQIIKGSCYRREYFFQRVRVARRLYSRGHSSVTIGIVMNRDHSSILGMVNPEVRSKRNERAKRAYHEC